MVPQPRLSDEGEHGGDERREEGDVGDLGDGDHDGVEVRAPPRLPISSAASSSASARSPLEAPRGAALSAHPRGPRVEEAADRVWGRGGLDWRRRGRHGIGEARVFTVLIF
jgi:hypothetical protein